MFSSGQKKESEIQFAKALRLIKKGRDRIIDSLPEIQKTPVLDKSDVDIISGAVDDLDKSIQKLKKSYDQKIGWLNENDN